MALRTDTMSNLSSASTEKPLTGLLRRITLLTVTMVEIAIGLAYLARFLLDRLPSWAVVALCDVLSGIVAGLATRFLLKRRSGILRLAAGLAFLVGGMLFQGWLTGWQVGLGPLEFGRSLTDWNGLGQFSLGMGVTLVALYAWQRPALRVDVAPTAPMPSQAPARPRPRTTGRSAQPTGRRLPRTRSRARTPVRARSPEVRAVPVVVAKKPAKPKRRRGFLRKTRLQLNGAEEHRCPYCLDLVSKKDPRGTVECKVCHTLHHADCWAITGTCQVPHLNN